MISVALVPDAYYSETMADECCSWADVEKLDVDSQGAWLTSRRIQDGKDLLAPQIELPEGTGSAGEAFLAAIDKCLTDDLQHRAVTEGNDKVPLN